MLTSFVTFDACAVRLFVFHVTSERPIMICYICWSAWNVSAYWVDTTLNVFMCVQE